MKNQKHTNEKKSARKSEAKNPKNIGLVDSIRQAAALTQTPLRILKAAKAAGCPAFRAGSRVHIGELTTWLANDENLKRATEHGGEIEQLEIKILREKLRVLRVKADQAENAVIEMDAARRTFVRFGAMIKSRILAVPASASVLLSRDLNVNEREAIIKEKIIDALKEIESHEWMEDAK